LIGDSEIRIQFSHERIKNLALGQAVENAGRLTCGESIVDDRELVADGGNVIARKLQMNAGEIDIAG